MRGGKREGAGRKPGARNKRTIEQVEAIQATGMTPLEFLTSVYQDENEDKGKRIDAAKAAAPYCHARLNSIEMSGKDGGPMETITRIELVPVEPGGVGED